MSIRSFLTETLDFMRKDVIEFAESAIHQEGAASPLDEGPAEDDYDREEIIDYSELIVESAFIGEMPFAEILKGIKDQFVDYINMEDTTNYVDIFYTQLDASFDSVNSDDEEEHPMEIKAALNKIKDIFVDTIFRLFNTRLTINITVVDDLVTEEDEVEGVIRKLYEYFILGARDNFLRVISKDIIPKIGIIPNDQDSRYFETVDTLLSDYDPLVTCITPTEFIDYTGDEIIQELYEDGRVSGNFLRKYSAKLYQNEEFKIDIINEITILQDLKEDILHGEQTAN